MTERRSHCNPLRLHTAEHTHTHKHAHSASRSLCVTHPSTSVTDLIQHQVSQPDPADRKSDPTRVAFMHFSRPGAIKVLTPHRFFQLTTRFWYTCSSFQSCHLPRRTKCFLPLLRVTLTNNGDTEVRLCWSHNTTSPHPQTTQLETFH